MSKNSKRFNPMISIDTEKLSDAIYDSGHTLGTLSLEMGAGDTYLSASLRNKKMSKKYLKKLCEILNASPSAFIADSEENKNILDWNDEPITNDFNDMLRKIADAIEEYLKY